MYLVRTQFFGLLDLSCLLLLVLSTWSQSQTIISVLKLNQDFKGKYTHSMLYKDTLYKDQNFPSTELCSEDVIVST